MTLVKRTADLKEIVKKFKTTNKKIGFVPTMGCLHEGHLSLIRKAKEENDIVVVSVFVNPTQFAPHEDFEDYPRNIDKDYDLAIGAGGDIIFNPETEEIYLKNFSSYVEVTGEITRKLCGKSRPTHFKGVTTVVNILFNIVNPDNAYFGQKDAQQAIIIQKMVRDLHMNVNIVVCPIIREEDGLAMSSRNTYLNAQEREDALILNQSLKAALNFYKNGEKDARLIKHYIVDLINTRDLANIDYVEVLDAETLDYIDTIEKKAIIVIAVRVGKTRLIDNVFLD